jgi:hypothetical protein
MTCGTQVRRKKRQSWGRPVMWKRSQLKDDSEGLLSINDMYNLCHRHRLPGICNRKDNCTLCIPQSPDLNVKSMIMFSHNPDGVFPPLSVTHLPDTVRLRSRSRNLRSQHANVAQFAQVINMTLKCPPITSARHLYCLSRLCSDLQERELINKEGHATMMKVPGTATAATTGTVYI